MDAEDHPDQRGKPSKERTWGAPKATEEIKQNTVVFNKDLFISVSDNIKGDRRCFLHHLMPPACHPKTHQRVKTFRYKPKENAVIIKIL